MKSRKIEQIGIEFRGKKQEKLKRYKLEYANEIFVSQVSMRERAKESENILSAIV